MFYIIHPGTRFDGGYGEIDFFFFFNDTLTYTARYGTPYGDDGHKIIIKLLLLFLYAPDRITNKLFIHLLFCFFFFHCYLNGNYGGGDNLRFAFSRTIRKSLIIQQYRQKIVINIVRSVSYIIEKLSAKIAFKIQNDR